MNLNKTFAAQGTSIFAIMSGLAVKHGAINLGQGFPDEDGPLAVREVAARHGPIVASAGTSRTCARDQKRRPICVPGGARGEPAAV